MNIPNIPTDSLYKFWTLAGLILFLVCLIFPGILLNDLMKHTNRVSAESRELDVDHNLLDRNIKLLENAANTEDTLLKV